MTPQLAPIITSDECSGVLKLVSGSPGLKLRTPLLRSALFKLDPMKRTEYLVLEWRHGIEKTLWFILKESHGLDTQWSICFMCETLSKAEFRPKLTFNPSLIHWSNKRDSRIRPTVITINTSHLLFSNPSPSRIVHSRSSDAPSSSSIAPLKITPNNSTNPPAALSLKHSLSHSQLRYHTHLTLALFLGDWMPFITMFQAHHFPHGNRSPGIFGLLSFPYSSDSMSQKPKTQIWQLTEASCQDRMDESTKLFYRPEKKKRQRTLHSYIYSPPQPFSYQES